MSLKLKLLAWMHGGGGQWHLPLRLGCSLVVACLLLLPAVSGAAATVVTHLPGFDGALPFYLETGYVSVEEETGTELFYYFVESERDPATDPVLLWLCGGPRCSVINSIVYGIGPVNFVFKPYDGTVPQLVYTPDSWTQMANVLFVDSPVGSGFSYARDPKGYDVGDISSSMQMKTFVRKWFDDHPQYLSNPFYVGGDSYAGKGYIVGNPLTGNKIDDNSRIPYSHSFGIISDQLYEAAMTNCEGNYANPTNKLCGDLVQTIDDLMSEVFYQNILENICPLGRQRALAEEHYQLGGPPDEPPFSCFGTVTEWIRCKKLDGLPYTFDLSSSIEYHFNLTSRGYRALVYR
ncbi:hypothetical protein ACP4OV_026566 [Aristida adscensionis]